MHRTAEIRTDVEKAFSASTLAISVVAEAGFSTSVTSPNGSRVEVASLDPDMERFGFVGLPNAGKSSLYNALAGGGAHAAPYAFATTDPNIGVAKVPDHRLDQLSGRGEDMVLAGAGRALYVVRNPLDVAASMAPFFDWTLDRAVEVLGDDGYLRRAVPTPA